MKVESENMKEQVATDELVRELVRDDARRGEYMIMMADADEERFVQIACDYEDVGCKNDGCFDLEYQDGTNGNLYHCKIRVSAEYAFFVSPVIQFVIRRKSRVRQGYAGNAESRGRQP